MRIEIFVYCDVDTRPVIVIFTLRNERERESSKCFYQKCEANVRPEITPVVSNTRLSVILYFGLKLA